MKVPGADRAIVEPEKVRDYLLSTAHPIGRFKAAFFATLGYHRDQWELLRDVLLSAVQSEEASSGRASPYGVKYEVRATLQGPSGRAAEVVSVWIVLTGEDVPRFVTAYPD